MNTNENKLNIFIITIINTIEFIQVFFFGKDGRLVEPQFEARKTFTMFKCIKFIVCHFQSASLLLLLLFC